MSSTTPQSRSVALVGRPNVGKSRLFNRLAGRRLAIVHDQPGVTRDVNVFTRPSDSVQLMDTGGIGLHADMTTKELVEAAEAQVFVAVRSAALILFVVDGREGLTPLDETVLAALRAEGKAPVLVVNKVDAPQKEGSVVADFARLGLSEVLAVSAEHNHGMDTLEDLISERLGPAPEDVEAADEEDEPRRISISFVGRPNVGKSSLVNGLLQDKRLVVSGVPGTTRDSVEHNLDYPGRRETEYFRLIDTAGLRKRTKVDSPVEYFSTLRSSRAMERSDVVFLVLDAREGVTTQDKALAGELVNQGKCVGVVVNKWDYAVETFERETLPGYDSLEEFRKSFATEVTRQLFTLPGSPVIFVSAKTGLDLHRVLGAARKLDRIAASELPTARINALLKRLLQHREPKLVQGKRFKIYYALQTGTRPLAFRFFCNRETKLDDRYRRYLMRGFLDEFGLYGCPIFFELVGKERRYAEKK